MPADSSNVGRGIGASRRVEARATSAPLFAQHLATPVGGVLDPTDDPADDIGPVRTRFEDLGDRARNPPRRRFIVDGTREIEDLIVTDQAPWPPAGGASMVTSFMSASLSALNLHIRPGAGDHARGMWYDPSAPAEGNMRGTNDIGGLPAGEISTTGHEPEYWQKALNAVVSALSPAGRNIIRIDEFPPLARGPSPRRSIVG